jgi:hypothetical protein
MDVMCAIVTIPVQRRNSIVRCGVEKLGQEEFDKILEGYRAPDEAEPVPVDLPTLLYH